MQYDLTKFAEAVSLAMTIPTVMLGLGVVYLWGGAAIKSLKDKTLDSHGWFILGVVVSFVGSVLDNLYWAIPWTSSFIGSDNTSFLMSIGVYFNIFFRQGAGIFAAYCHLKAADLSSTTPSRIANRLLAISNILAVGACLFMGMYLVWKHSF